LVLEPILLSSGQHRQMLDQTLAVFGLKPDLDLNLMQPGQKLPDLTARVVTQVSAILRELRPAAILAQGDTTTVLGAALAAFYERVPLGHVEAGLRTYNYEAPWPEEMNRRLADPISRWCFAPTDWSAANLIAERIPADRVHVTGNTVVDALLWVRKKLCRSSHSAAKVAARCSIPEEFARQYLSEQGKRFVLITGHRRESFGQGFENICQSIAELARRHPELGLLYPVHLNPNVQEPVRRILGENPRVALIPPVDYEDFIWLMDHCHFVLSDSGGVQEEAPTLGKPVLVMRETTERPEGVDAGTCRLVGTNITRILEEAEILLNDSTEYARRAQLQNPYGDGRASERIREILEKSLG
jgi:UDP-N-acetylglucosamine 2-epimerase